MRAETDLHRLTIDIPTHLHKMVKVNAVLNDMSVKDYIVNALGKEIAEEFASVKKSKKPNKVTLAALKEIEGKNYKTFSSPDKA